MLPEPGGGKEEEGEPRDARGKVYRFSYMSRASTVVAKCNIARRRICVETQLFIFMTSAPAVALWYLA